jgi:uroporphyrinogen decarboxylase
MKHRERILMALNHEVPDRCPMQVSFTPEFAVRLREDMRIEESKLHNPHGGGNTYVLERRLGGYAHVGRLHLYYQDAATYVDEWGIVDLPGL